MRNLQLESQLPVERFDDLVVRPESVVTKLVDLISVENLQSFHDFDLVSENYVEGFEKPFSDELNFKSRILTDFSESVSNRVVTIDDFRTCLIIMQDQLLLLMFIEIDYLMVEHNSL